MSDGPDKTPPGGKAKDQAHRGHRSTSEDSHDGDHNHLGSVLGPRGLDTAEVLDLRRRNSDGGGMPWPEKHWMHLLPPPPGLPPRPPYGSQAALDLAAKEREEVAEVTSRMEEAVRAGMPPHFMYDVPAAAAAAAAMFRPPGMEFSSLRELSMRYREPTPEGAALHPAFFGFPFPTHPAFRNASPFLPLQLHPEAMGLFDPLRGHQDGLHGDRGHKESEHDRSHGRSHDRHRSQDHRDRARESGKTSKEERKKTNGLPVSDASENASNDIRECHSRDSHSRDSHSRDSHSRDSHSRDCHSRDSHSRDCHSRDSHSRDCHSRDSHSSTHSRDSCNMETHSRESHRESRESHRENRESHRESRDSHRDSRDSRDSHRESRDSRDSRDSQSRDSQSRDSHSWDSYSREPLREASEHRSPPPAHKGSLTSSISSLPEHPVTNCMTSDSPEVELGERGVQDVPCRVESVSPPGAPPYKPGRLPSAAGRISSARGPPAMMGRKSNHDMVSILDPHRGPDTRPNSRPNSSGSSESVMSRDSDGILVGNSVPTSLVLPRGTSSVTPNGADSHQGEKMSGPPPLVSSQSSKCVEDVTSGQMTSSSGGSYLPPRSTEEVSYTMAPVSNTAVPRSTEETTYSVVPVPGGSAGGSSGDGTTGSLKFRFSSSPLRTKESPVYKAVGSPQRTPNPSRYSYWPMTKKQRILGKAPSFYQVQANLEVPSKHVAEDPSSPERITKKARLLQRTKPVPSIFKSVSRDFPFFHGRYARNIVKSTVKTSSALSFAPEYLPQSLRKPARARPKMPRRYMYPTRIYSLRNRDKKEEEDKSLTLGDDDDEEDEEDEVKKTDTEEKEGSVKKDGVAKDSNARKNKDREEKVPDKHKAKDTSRPKRERTRSRRRSTGRPVGRPPKGVKKRESNDDQNQSGELNTLATSETGSNAVDKSSEAGKPPCDKDSSSKPESALLAALKGKLPKARWTLGESNKESSVELNKESCRELIKESNRELNKESNSEVNSELSTDKLAEPVSNKQAAESDGKAETGNRGEESDGPPGDVPPEPSGESLEKAWQHAGTQQLDMQPKVILTKLPPNMVSKAERSIVAENSTTGTTSSQSKESPTKPVNRPEGVIPSASTPNKRLLGKGLSSINKLSEMLMSRQSSKEVQDGSMAPPPAGAPPPTMTSPPHDDRKARRKGLARRLVRRNQEGSFEDTEGSNDGFTNASDSGSGTEWISRSEGAVMDAVSTVQTESLPGYTRTKSHKTEPEATRKPSQEDLRNTKTEQAVPGDSVASNTNAECSPDAKSEAEVTDVANRRKRKAASSKNKKIKVLWNRDKEEKVKLEQKYEKEELECTLTSKVPSRVSDEQPPSPSNNNKSTSAGVTAMAKSVGLSATSRALGLLDAHILDSGMPMAESRSMSRTLADLLKTKSTEQDTVAEEGSLHSPKQSSQGKLAQEHTALHTEPAKIEAPKEQKPEQKESTQSSREDLQGRNRSQEATSGVVELVNKKSKKSKRREIKDEKPPTLRRLLAQEHPSDSDQSDDVPLVDIKKKLSDEVMEPPKLEPPPQEQEVAEEPPMLENVHDGDDYDDSELWDLSLGISETAEKQKEERRSKKNKKSKKSKSRRRNRDEDDEIPKLHRMDHKVESTEEPSGNANQNACEKEIGGTNDMSRSQLHMADDVDSRTSRMKTDQRKPLHIDDCDRKSCSGTPGSNFMVSDATLGPSSDCEELFIATKPETIPKLEVEKSPEHVSQEGEGEDYSLPHVDTSPTLSPSTLARPRVDESPCPEDKSPVEMSRPHVDLSPTESPVELCNEQEPTPLRERADSSAKDSNAKNLSIKESSTHNQSIKDSSVKNLNVKDSNGKNQSIKDSGGRNLSIKDSSAKNLSLKDTTGKNLSVKDSTGKNVSIKDSSTKNLSVKDSSGKNLKNLRDSSTKERKGSSAKDQKESSGKDLNDLSAKEKKDLTVKERKDLITKNLRDMSAKERKDSNAKDQRDSNAKDLNDLRAKERKDSSIKERWDSSAKDHRDSNVKELNDLSVKERKDLRDVNARNLRDSCTKEKRDMSAKESKDSGVKNLRDLSTKERKDSCTKDVKDMRDTKERRESSAKEKRDLRDSSTKERKDSRAKDLRDRGAKERREPSPKDLRDSSAKDRKDSSTKERRESNAMDLKDLSAKDRRDSSPKDLRDSRAKERRELSAKNLKDSSPKERRESSTKSLRDSNAKDWSLKDTRESSSKDQRNLGVEQSVKNRRDSSEGWSPSEQSKSPPAGQIVPVSIVSSGDEMSPPRAKKPRRNSSVGQEESKAALEGAGTVYDAFSDDASSPGELVIASPPPPPPPIPPPPPPPPPPTPPQSSSTDFGSSRYPKRKTSQSGVSPANPACGMPARKDGKELRVVLKKCSKMDEMTFLTPKAPASSPGQSPRAKRRMTDASIKVEEEESKQAEEEKVQVKKRHIPEKKEKLTRERSDRRENKSSKNSNIRSKKLELELSMDSDGETDAVDRALEKVTIHRPHATADPVFIGSPSPPPITEFKANFDLEKKDILPKTEPSKHEQSLGPPPSKRQRRGRRRRGRSPMPDLHQEQAPEPETHSERIMPKRNAKRPPRLQYTGRGVSKGVDGQLGSEDDAESEDERPRKSIYAEVSSDEDLPPRPMKLVPRESVLPMAAHKKIPVEKCTVVQVERKVSSNPLKLKLKLGNMVHEKVIENNEYQEAKEAVKESPHYGSETDTPQPAPTPTERYSIYHSKASSRSTSQYSDSGSEVSHKPSIKLSLKKNRGGWKSHKLATPGKERKDAVYDFDSDDDGLPKGAKNFADRLKHSTASDKRQTPKALSFAERLKNTSAKRGLPLVAMAREEASTAEKNSRMEVASPGDAPQNKATKPRQKKGRRGKDSITEPVLPVLEREVAPPSATASSAGTSPCASQTRMRHPTGGSTPAQEVTQVQLPLAQSQHKSPYLPHQGLPPPAQGPHMPAQQSPYVPPQMPIPSPYAMPQPSPSVSSQPSPHMPPPSPHVVPPSPHMPQHSPYMPAPSPQMSYSQGRSPRQASIHSPPSLLPTTTPQLPMHSTPPQLAAQMPQLAAQVQAQPQWQSHMSQMQQTSMPNLQMSPGASIPSLQLQSPPGQLQSPAGQLVSPHSLQSPVAQLHTPPSQGRSPGSQLHTPPSQGRSPGVAVQGRSPGAQCRSPRTRSPASGSQMYSPITPMSSPPAIQPPHQQQQHMSHQQAQQLHQHPHQQQQHQQQPHQQQQQLVPPMSWQSPSCQGEGDGEIELPELPLNDTLDTLRKLEMLYKPARNRHQRQQQTDSSDEVRRLHIPASKFMPQPANHGKEQGLADYEVPEFSSSSGSESGGDEAKESGGESSGNEAEEAAQGEVQSHDTTSPESGVDTKTPASEDKPPSSVEEAKPSPEPTASTTSVPATNPTAKNAHKKTNSNMHIRFPELPCEEDCQCCQNESLPDLLRKLQETIDINTPAQDELAFLNEVDLFSCDSGISESHAKGQTPSSIRSGSEHNDNLNSVPEHPGTFSVDNSPIDVNSFLSSVLSDQPTGATPPDMLAQPPVGTPTEPPGGVMGQPNMDHYQTMMGSQIGGLPGMEQLAGQHQQYNGQLNDSLQLAMQHLNMPVLQPEVGQPQLTSPPVQPPQLPQMQPPPTPPQPLMPVLSEFSLNDLASVEMQFMQPATIENKHVPDGEHSLPKKSKKKKKKKSKNEDKEKAATEEPAPRPQLVQQSMPDPLDLLFPSAAENRMDQLLTAVNDDDDDVFGMGGKTPSLVGGGRRISDVAPLANQTLWEPTTPSKSKPSHRMYFEEMEAAPQHGGGGMNTSWMSSSMGMYTCICGEIFTDNWQYQQHEAFCTGGL